MKGTHDLPRLPLMEIPKPIYTEEELDHEFEDLTTRWQACTKAQLKKVGSEFM